MGAFHKVVSPHVTLLRAVRESRLATFSQSVDQKWELPISHTASTALYAALSTRSLDLSSTWESSRTTLDQLATSAIQRITMHTLRTVSSLLSSTTKTTSPPPTSPTSRPSTDLCSSCSPKTLWSTPKSLNGSRPLMTRTRTSFHSKTATSTRTTTSA